MKTFAWDIWFYCNYDCKFCNTKTKILPVETYDADKIFDAWHNIYNKYGKCKICITGGEPLLYPNINLVIEKLSSIHYVHITTNLSMDIDSLSNKNIDRNNTFFNVTFHPFYENIHSFISKLLKLKKYGYAFSVCYMNDDFQLMEFNNYKKLLKQHNIDITINDSLYQKNQKLKKVIDNNSIRLYNYIVEPKEICNAGVSYACVDFLGEVYSCSVLRKRMGNIFNNTFSFFDEHITCNKECKSFENKY